VQPILPDDVKVANQPPQPVTKKEKKNNVNKQQQPPVVDKPLPTRNN